VEGHLRALKEVAEAAARSDDAAGARDGSRIA
jgi:hypothetical protein